MNRLSSSSSLPSTTIHTINLTYIQNSLPSKIAIKEETKEATSSILFIHGLDSSSHTWRKVLTKLASVEVPAIAIDCRGCGSSPLGNPNEFTRESIVEDVKRVAECHPFFQNNRPFVIVGHSMGGRIAIEYAAKYPQHISALVVEDMDIRRRFMKENPFCGKNRQNTLTFERNIVGGETKEGVIDAFSKEGYPKQMVLRWLDEGRIYRKPIEPTNIDKDQGTEEKSSSELGPYYSDVNPAFRLLCYEQFCDNESTTEAWIKIVTDGTHKFPCYIMVAGKNETICDESSIEMMKKIMTRKNHYNDDKGKTNDEQASHRVQVKYYQDAKHSIHNSDQEQFVIDLKDIINKASRVQRRL